ncbi:di-trans,poly-cis-decaprenylcistransferase [Polyangium jinanense]|uniref:polyprenyl diphosphate synthase n=1 Tax=Polyangium jinanense TaxID=2829994 RepID=UPI00233FC683|nr:polyprenyl diphosphate synthase [Polyangium jinanense]MDC3962414.1 di-trans,poly-cis-decaprenylcistransferase [Polyangium jinanense]
MNERSSLPRHIALILDGNGRWATSRGLPRTKGHEAGSQKVRLAVRACHERKIPVLTLYAFSAANWNRPGEEVGNLMRICREFADEAHDDLVARGVRVVVVGDIDDEVPTATRKATEKLIADTADGTSMTLALALNYGGRRDMVSAMRAVAAQARAGLLLPEDIDSQTIRRFLSTSELPDADLVIRTGGEQRLSDFLPFEAAFAELFFTDTLWPDFSEGTLDEALAFYARRQRRFGRTDEQVRRTAEI